ncbi:hypothetical protein CAMRE0001_0741 [Campylobacter rectus RM3267]|uniref:Uncharacterized protein n=1 Tax=Campylobacter rectus RM3267 TaxID=553218 RepID=B9CZP9_CAMRE|nr:hypothetical protein CAMRE0001_0741 [Campylobacter rectus RM3267]
MKVGMSQLGRTRICFANGSADLLKFKTQISAKFQICRNFKLQI